MMDKSREEILEKILEDLKETQRVEYKSACSWDEDIFCRDILAMANVQDGGYIIVGVRELPDGTFEREGVTEEQKNSFKIDIMKDQMNKYADPYVDFDVKSYEYKGKTYVVIRVYPFDEIPVICKIDSKTTKKGVIYYRSRNRRPESAPVSNSYDMKEIIERAVAKMWQKKRELGFTVESPMMNFSVREKLDEELEGL